MRRNPGDNMLATACSIGCWSACWSNSHSKLSVPTDTNRGSILGRAVALSLTWNKATGGGRGGCRLGSTPTVSFSLGTATRCRVSPPLSQQHGWPVTQLLLCGTGGSCSPHTQCVQPWAAQHAAAQPDADGSAPCHNTGPASLGQCTPGCSTVRLRQVAFGEG